MPVTPGPLNVPPAGVPTKVTKPALIQTGPTGVIDTAESALIITSTVAEAEHPLLLVTVRVYVPAAATETPTIVGFWRVEVNQLGPVHA